MEQILTLPYHTTLLMGEPSPRGYRNQDALFAQAVLPTSTGNVSARDYFHAAENRRRKLTPVERGILLQCLNPEFLRAFSYELPFIIEGVIDGVSGSAVEIYMRGFRYVAYMELMDTTHKLFQLVQIPFDASDPEIHIMNTRKVAPILEAFA